MFVGPVQQMFFGVSFGCLLDVFRMPLGCFLNVFGVSFGCLLHVFGYLLDLDGHNKYHELGSKADCG